VRALYKSFYKGALSKILVCICILIFSPVMIIAAIMIRLDSKGGVFFKQKRLGKDGKPFEIIKFRSMVENAQNIGSGIYTYDGDPRITKVGAFIRKTSIDELPQLFNILKGDMAFIGPRPLLLDVPYSYGDYPDEVKSRFDVYPGLFCLVDAKYRADVSLEEHLKLDAYYAEHVSLWLDIKIFFMTFKMVLLQKGVYVGDEEANAIKENEKVKEMSETK